MSSDRHYVPPSARQIEQYARKVCQTAGEDCSKRDVMIGFTGFLKHMMAIYTRQLNAQAASETSEEES